MSLIERIRRGAYVPSAEPSAGARGAPTSLAETAVRVSEGQDLLVAVREFLDQLNRRTNEEVARLVLDSPGATGSPEGDALLAGIAEHVAAARSLLCPAWTREPHRFLDRFWFVSSVPGFRAAALAQTPMALKRRGIFWPARSLERV